jgi:hypothetical protein
VRLPLAPLTLGLAMLAASPVRAAGGTDACSGFVDVLPAVIDTAGTWCLRTDLSTDLATGAAITLAANNVVLDCNGRLIDGTGSTASGVVATGRSDTVRGCSVSGFTDGIRMAGDAALVDAVRVEGASARGVVVAGEGAAVRDSRVLATTGSTGIVVEATASVASLTGSIVDGVSGADATGIAVLGGSGHAIAANRIRGLAPSTGEAVGLRLEQATATVTGNAIDAASGIGIACDQAPSLVRGNSILGAATALAGCDDDGGNIAVAVPDIRALVVSLAVGEARTLMVAFGTTCPYSSSSATFACAFEAPLVQRTLTFANYVGVRTVGSNVVVIDRKVCLPTHVKLGPATISAVGAPSETTEVVVYALGTVDYSLVAAVVDEGTTCPAGLSFSP